MGVEICRYLKVWCIAISLRGGTEASCTIWQVSDCLLGEGALDDVGVIAILLQGRGAVTYTNSYTLIHTDISTLHEVNTQN